KIRLKFLEAMEADDFSKLPSLGYAKGFVKNYSDYLGLDSAAVLAFFRRQTEDVTRASLLPKGMAEPLNKPMFILTPGRFLALLVASFGVVFFLYFGLQYRRLYQAPQLIIEQPVGESVAKEKRIDILGRTDPDATVTVNGMSVLVRSDGRFFDQLSLVSGVNRITVVATSRFGKITTVTRNVGFQQP
ncbi:helix-turn-helix domain-containing protein, partial [Candidatus Gottesmanbacteria bacterium]|nr:helix-turn-helix domain-containing protein [Candidatus Gottesmanbacteria bacterium]